MHSLYEYKSHKETCIQKASKGRQGLRRGKFFAGSYVLSLYEYKSHKETCIQQSKQTRECKGRQGVIKGEFFSQGLMSFPYMNANLTKRLVFNKQADKGE